MEWELGRLTALFQARVETDAARMFAEIHAQLPDPPTPPSSQADLEEPDAATGRAADEAARALGYRDAAHQRGAERGKAARARRMRECKDAPDPLRAGGVAVDQVT